MTPQQRADFQELGYTFTDVAVGHMNTAADLSETAAYFPIILAEISGLKPQVGSYPVVCRPLVEAGLEATKTLLRMNPFYHLQAWNDWIIEHTVAMSPAPLQNSLSQIFQTGNVLASTINFQLIEETLEDLSQVARRLPDTITFTGPMETYSPSEARAEEKTKNGSIKRPTAVEREALDFPKDVNVKFSLNPGINLRGVSEVFRVVGGNHSRHDDFSIQCIDFMGQKTPVHRMMIDDTPLARHELFYTGQELGPHKLTVLGPPLSGHPPSFVQPMVEHLLKAGYAVLLPNFKDPRHHENPNTIHGLDEHVTEYAHCFRLASGLSQGNFHSAAVCEPGSSMLSATVYNQLKDGDTKNIPLSVTLINSPIYPGAAETAITEITKLKNFEYFERMAAKAKNGVGIYDGNVDAFIAKTPGRHMQGLANISNAIIQGNQTKALAEADKYEAFFQRRPIASELYLGLVKRQFIEGELGKGTFSVHDFAIDPTHLQNMHLHTVGADQDDITHEIQCMWAQVLCPGIVQQGLGYHSLIQGTGHYGPWGRGRSATQEAMPKIIEVMHRAEEHSGLENGPFIVNGQEQKRVEMHKYHPHMLELKQAELRVAIPEEHLKIIPQAS